MRIAFLTALFLLLYADVRSQSIIEVQGTDFIRDGKAYVFMGANLWYGMNLGSPGEGGDRDRLIRELDRLAAMGITNLRVMGSTEGPNDIPYRSVPAMQTAPGEYDENLFIGLDFLIAEMAKRDMTAVVCLNNFWMWSGGFPQYRSWSNGSEIPFPDIENGSSWQPFIDYSMEFYTDKKAQQLFRDHLKVIINRTNSITGIQYTEDPTIMSWQLANEPRGYNNPAAYRKWLVKTAKLIQRLDRNHLVCSGTEGNTSTPDSGIDLLRDNKTKHLDYATTHVWIQNWSWFDPSKPETFEPALGKARIYLKNQLELAEELGKPVVLEEFGVSRDDGDFSASTNVKYRDLFYNLVFELTSESISKNGILKGCNFWAWGGEGTPVSPGALWNPGEPLNGDPPHERQGWYSVYNGDTSTINLITEYASLINAK